MLIREPNLWQKYDRRGGERAGSAADAISILQNERRPHFRRV